MKDEKYGVVPGGELEAPDTCPHLSCLNSVTNHQSPITNEIRISPQIPREVFPSAATILLA